MDSIPDERKVVGLVEKAREHRPYPAKFQLGFWWSRVEAADFFGSIAGRCSIRTWALPRCSSANPRSPLNGGLDNQAVLGLALLVAALDWRK